MELVPEEMVRVSYLEQAQLSQAYRWIVSCLSDSSDEGAAVLLMNETAVIPDRIRDISDINITSVHPSVEELVTRIYCICRLNSGETKSIEICLHFANLTPDFPLVTSVEVKEVADMSLTAKPNTLERSRILSLKHRWHSLVENPTKHTEPFREIITEDFTMDWGKGSWSGFDNLAEWLESTSKISASRHDIASFDCALLDRTSYEARFEFAWSGLSLEGEPMQAESEHRWLIEEDLTARFPKIARMEVNLRVPFHIVKT